MLHYCYSSQHTHWPDRKITFYQNINPWLDSVNIYVPNKLATQTPYVGDVIDSGQWTLYQISCHTMVQPSVCFLQLHEHTRQTVGTVNWAQFKVNGWSLSLWNMKDRTDFFLGYFIMPQRCKQSFSFISIGTFMMT